MTTRYKGKYPTIFLKCEENEKKKQKLSGKLAKFKNSKFKKLTKFT